MATPYNPYDANRAMALPRQQQQYAQQKTNQQVNRPAGPKARPGHLKALAEAKKMTTRVRVEPATEELREVLEHPNGMRFRSQGSVEWPFDRYTQRRLREGSIRIVQGANSMQGRQETAQRARAEHGRTAEHKEAEKK
jgi:hypothetical protein